MHFNKIPPSRYAEDMKKLITILILFVASTSVSAQNFTPQFNVTLSVSADEVIRNRIYSSIAREFRSFDDVNIVNDDTTFAFHFVVSIVAVETGTTSNISTGYAASITVDSKFNANTLVEGIGFLEAQNLNIEDFKKQRDIVQKMDEKFGNLIRNISQGAVFNRYHGLMIDSEIDSLTKRVVSEIDYEVFERIRTM